MFTRLQAESDPPFVDRRDSPELGTQDTGALVEGDDPSTAFMDLHATLGTHCSRFEIAWSDGSTWPVNEPEYRRDIDGDGVDDIIFKAGDLIWFDIDFPRLDPDSSNDLDDVVNTVNFPAFGVDRDPEIVQSRRKNRLWLNRSNFGPYVIAPVGNRDSMWTAGVADQDRTSREYLALWGYRSFDPSGSGEFTDDAWPKPRLIRVRLTLHDSQLRLDGGRSYEFIFPINLRP
jgi:hypothetical protein